MLKWILNVVRRFVAQTESHAVDQGRHVGRILQAAGERRAHPSARAGRRARDRIAAANTQDRPVFRVTDEDAIEDIPPREICAEVEDTGIARRRNSLDDPGETDLVAQLRIAFPACAEGRGAGLAVAIELDRIELEKKGREVVRRNLGSLTTVPVTRDGPRSFAEARAQFLARSVVQLREVQSEESSGDERDG